MWPWLLSRYEVRHATYYSAVSACTDPHAMRGVTSLFRSYLSRSLESACHRYGNQLPVQYRYFFIRPVCFTSRKISIVHNPQLKARVQCAHRKTQNKYLLWTNRAHNDYHTMDNLRGERKKKKKKQKKSAGQQPERWKALRLLTVPSVHKHIIK